VDGLRSSLQEARDQLAAADRVIDSYKVPSAQRSSPGCPQSSYKLPTKCGCRSFADFDMPHLSQHLLIPRCRRLYNSQEDAAGSDSSGIGDAGLQAELRTFQQQLQSVADREAELLAQVLC